MILEFDGEYLQLTAKSDEALNNILFSLAVEYNKILGWNIQKPSSWRSSGPHITVSSSSFTNQNMGKTFPVIIETTNIKHFKTSTSWWIVLKPFEGQLPNFYFPYDCHLSIGQCKK
jgi:hypothetical protein